MATKRSTRASDPRVTEAIRNRLSRVLTEETGSFFGSTALDRMADALADTALNSPHVLTWAAAQERIERHARRERQHLDRAAAAEVVHDNYRCHIQRQLSDPALVPDRELAQRIADACHVLLLPIDEPEA